MKTHHCIRNHTAARRAQLFSRKLLVAWNTRRNTRAHMGPSRRSESLYFSEVEKRYLSNTTEPYDPQVTRREQPERTARPSIQIQHTDCDITTETVITKRSDISFAILIEDGPDLTVYRSSIGRYHTTGDQRLPEIPAPESLSAIQWRKGDILSGGILCQDNKSSRHDERHTMSRSV